MSICKKCKREIEDWLMHGVLCSMCFYGKEKHKNIDARIKGDKK